MLRPCTCDRLPPAGQPYSVSYCRLCWLYHRDSAYRELWNADAPRGPCVHLGEATGETRECSTCTGTVRLKLFACTLHRECTIARAIDGVACCAACSDYRERA